MDNWLTPVEMDDLNYAKVTLPYEKDDTFQAINWATSHAGTRDIDWAVHYEHTSRGVFFQFKDPQVAMMFKLIHQ